MRVLVAGRNAKVLAQVAGAFASDLTIETATTKAASLGLLERAAFDVVIACEKLGDGSGLEVLSHVAVNTPDTLRIFAARPSTLDVLKGELGLFGLFRTLTYPINFRKVWAALDLARSCRVDGEPAPRIRHVVLDTTWDEPQVAHDAPADATATAITELHPRPSTAAVPARSSTRTHLPPRVGAARTNTAAMLASTEPTNAPATTAAAREGAAARPRTTAPSRAATPARTADPPRAIAPARANAPARESAPARANAPSRAPSAARVVASPTRAPGPTRALVGAQATAPARSTGPARGPASTRATVTGTGSALAQVNARATANVGATANPRAMTATVAGTAGRKAANARAAKAPQAAARIPESDAFKRALARRSGANGRQEPSVTNESLAQLAQLSVRRRPPNNSLGIPGGRKRTAFFVGSGVFAAGAAAVLTFFMLHTNNSIRPSTLPMVASITSNDRPIPQKVFPWQPPSAQPKPTTFVPNEAVAPAAADMEVEAEAASEQPGIEPGHPGPPPPIPPPGPSEPPSYDASGNPIEE